jgi:2-polyprenyl-3-methyl-5-hydroxy-6-metoxy-1,4-benzoquinol methylase
VADENEQVRAAWSANARFWDRRMGEGNDWFNVLIWPSVERLLQIQPGETVLDIGCGNGLTSRRLARSGADIVAFDFSDEMIAIANARGSTDRIDYRVVDATDTAALQALGRGRFDAALCNMVLMDLADMRPLMLALPSLLRPAGRFVFSLLHPCFNNPSVVQTGELENRGEDMVTTYSVKVSRYLTPYSQPGVAMQGQPVPHLYFHRPMSQLLGEGFKAGLVLDALEEPGFPASDAGGSTPLSWNGHFTEIPPILVGRMRSTQ